MSNFEINREGFRSIGGIGSMQCGAPAVHSQVLADVRDYQFSEVFTELVVCVIIVYCCTSHFLATTLYNSNKFRKIGFFKLIYTMDCKTCLELTKYTKI